jgi:hypothetical protein
MPGYATCQWVDYFFNETDLEGTKLLLALAVAARANSLDQCNPGIPYLARRIRKGERYTRQLYAQLVADGYIAVLDNESGGRGRTPTIQLQRVRGGAPFTDAERVRSSAEKSALQRPERVRSSAPAYKEDPSEEPNENHSPENSARGDFFVPNPLTVGAAKGPGRPKAPGYPPEVEIWLDAMAPLIGARAGGFVFNADKWRDSIAEIIRAGYELRWFLYAVKSSLQNHKNDNRERYFGPNAVLKQLQLSTATAGLDPYSGMPWGR